VVGSGRRFRLFLLLFVMTNATTTSFSFVPFFFFFLVGAEEDEAALSDVFPWLLLLPFFDLLEDVVV
jgi:hypothetical protein